MSLAACLLRCGRYSRHRRREAAIGLAIQSHYLARSLGARSCAGKRGSVLNALDRNDPNRRSKEYDQHPDPADCPEILGRQANWLGLLAISGCAPMLESGAYALLTARP